MKLLKKGFSLAEILLTLAIVSVIAVIGFSATKKGIESSYNLYIYTGYKGLLDAIKISYPDNGDIESVVGAGAFFRSIAENLNANLVSPAANTRVITANNGVQYIFTGPYTDNSVTPELKYYAIEFRVPYKKIVSGGNVNNNLSFNLYYFYSPAAYNFIIPEYGIENNGSGINILERKDILPFYVDNGRVGRTIGGTYNPKTYYSWREAWCRTYNPIIEQLNHPKNLSADEWSCDGFTEDLTGVLIPENPRKAF